MKIVVTGGSGRIGSAVVRHLAGLGHEVLNLDRRRPRDADAPGRFLHTDLARRDVLEPRLVEFAPDACCHLAEIPDARRGAEEQVYGENALATGTMFQALADIGVKRIAYASSCQVYAQFGAMPPNYDVRPPLALPVTEDSEPPRPNNGYGAQKAGAEMYLGGLAHRHGITAAALRIPGCGDFLNADWLPHAFRRDGGRSRWGERNARHELGAWLDHADCCAAFAACVCWPEGPPPWRGCESFNVAADEVWHRRDDPPVAGQLAESAPHFPPLPADFPAFGALFNSEKLKRATDWRPRVAMRDLWEKAGLGADA